MLFGKTGKSALYFCLFQMIKKNIVYSTDRGTLCPKCEEQTNNCICSDQAEKPKNLRPIFIEEQTVGRKGKSVSVIRNVPLEKTELKKCRPGVRTNGVSCTARVPVKKVQVPSGGLCV